MGQALSHCSVLIMRELPLYHREIRTEFDPDPVERCLVERENLDEKALRLFDARQSGLPELKNHKFLISSVLQVLQ